MVVSPSASTRSHGTLVIVERFEPASLRTMGPLGISVTDGASFDIGPDGTALLVVPG